MKIKIDQNLPLFFSSDLHYNHARIIQYTNRPFNSVTEMNEELIRRWNEKVPKNATVIFCGDFVFGNSNTFYEVYNKLNGQIIFVYGNHDKPIPKEIRKYDVVEFSYNKNYFFCSHYAHKVWNLSHHGSIHLYGHSHGSLEDDKNSLSMDVGIDCHKNLEPFSVEEVLEFMKTKEWKPIDHHSNDKLQEKIGEE